MTPAKKKTTRKSAADRLDFGRAFEELEGIIEWFEKGEVDLEEGLQKFERGLELAQVCKGRLQVVENRVHQLKAKFGELAE